jgi:hypothetical protein
MKASFKILILSVGSLLGQCVLDVLEGRRQGIKVIGLNSQTQNPCNFRCDRTYLMPLSAHGPAFTERFLEILALESPNLILPGRDEDVLFLAEFREAYPAHAARIPCGTPAAARIVNDKYHTWQWAQSQGLPFAESFLLTSGSRPQLPAFLNSCGYPLIAKPREGFGSQRVCFVRCGEGIDQLAQNGDVFLQEYLGKGKELEADFARYDHQCGHNVPLFFQIPETTQYAAQTLIGPDGRQGAAFCSVNTMIMGRVEVFRQQALPKLEALLGKYAQALAAIGWRGCVNLQAKPDAAGVWKGFELNLRMTGGTSSRLHFSFDELGLLLQAYYPEFAFPVLKGAAIAGTVIRRLHDTFIPDSWVDALARNGVWQA